MAELNITKNPTRLQQSQKFLQGGYQKTSKIVEHPDEPVARFILGLAVYPIVFASQITTQACLQVLNVHTYNDLTDRVNRAVELLNPIYLGQCLNKSLLFHEIITSAGKELFYREFTQSYLLDKKLTFFLSKISPNMGEYPKTTSGAAIRVRLTSAFFTWLADEHTFWYQSNARLLNSFIFHVFCGALREKTGSIVPGVALNVARDIYGSGF